MSLSSNLSVLWLGAFVVLLFLSSALRYIPNNRVGIVEKRASGKGSVKTGLITLSGEAGFEPQLLRGGWHFLPPFQYRVHRMPLVTIPQGKIGYVFARDGRDLAPTQALAANVQAKDFQDTAAFLAAGGQKGPQRSILREGTYAINLVQFVVLTADRLYYLPLDRSEEEVFVNMARLIGDRDGFRPVVLRDAEDKIGIITVHDGPSLTPGEIIAPMVGNEPKDVATYHNNFQDPDRFLAAGGRRGRQLQVVVEGTYYVNRLFATVELIPKTIVEVGNVGVVVSYTGETGEDLSGTDYKHGELVSAGHRGVWSVPLLPGKYAWNTYAGKVVVVPTTNFILKWNRAEVGSHHFDENLAEVSLITRDAFEPSLPLSVVVHIDYRKAPLVIQRFGDVKRLVEQTLDPMVSAYFKNVGQTRTLIQLLQDRSAIQEIAGVQMKERFQQYNLDLEEVLIGTPSAGTGGQIEEILAQLRSRQIAEEKVETYRRQQGAAVKERELKEAESRARQQTLLTESEISITVQENEGKAEYARAQQKAVQIEILARADAERTARVGIAQAMVVEEQVKAYGGPQYQLMQQVMGRFAEAIEKAQVDLVPRVHVGGGKTSGSGNLIENLLGLLLSEKVGESFGIHASAGAETAANPLAEALKAEMRAKLPGGTGGIGASAA